MTQIEVRGLRKSFGSTAAVDGVDLDVRPGEILAVVGGAGTGKSVLLGLLAGAVRRDSGTMTVLGTDPAAGGRAWRSRIGRVGQSAADTAELTVRAAIRHYGRFFAGPRDTAELLELTGLSGVADAAVRGLSGGVRRRADIALALAGDPRVLLVDEPAAGVGHAERIQVRAVLRRVAARGVTVVLATRDRELLFLRAESCFTVVRGRS
jgi:ABC-2 type transport system ATP-binding protein